MRRKTTKQARKETRDIIHEYTNVSELLKDVNEIADTMNESELKGMIRFAGCGETRNEVNSNINSGTPEYLERYLKQKKSFELTHTSLSTETTKDVTGLYFNISEVINGEPEHWYSDVMIESNSFIKIEVNICCGAQTAQAEIFNKLSKIINIIDQLESSGTRVNLWLNIQNQASINNKYAGKTDIRIQVKKHDEILEIQRLVYLACSGVLLRYCAFILRWKQVGEYFGSYISLTESATNYNNEILYIQSMYKDQIIGPDSIENIIKLVCL